MMKKLLIPIMMMLATIAVVPGNSNEAVKASAEETKGDVTNKLKMLKKVILQIIYLINQKAI